MNKVIAEDLEKILGFKLDKNLRDKIQELTLSYRELTQEERDDYLLDVINVLGSNVTQAGKHRAAEWEFGWGENLTKFKETKSIEDLVPRYHGKNQIIRWKGDAVWPLTPQFDYKIHICFVDAILQHYLGQVKNIFEFGCGPAYHLIRLHDFNKHATLTGLDWTRASQKIIREINNVLNTDINASRFNFFKPDYSLEIPEDSGIYTVAALEQVGDNFKDFIDFLMEKNPKVCIHIEPIDELLDDGVLLDSLSIKYFRKRRYLSGFLPYLEKLEKDQKIDIISKRRTYTGSYFIEGHSLVVWKPKN